ncbi:MAG: hypothetical protein LUQ57_00800 [Methylococcaceae bacterium]|nr:hypothetical protein [Methylococcaceae bacterium]
MKRLIISGAFLWAISSPPIALATSYGPVENFDVVNDTGKVAHGFEIELHGISRGEITSIFGDASRWPDMERYGAPTVTEYTDEQYGASTRITYKANFDGANWSAGTPSGTLPVNPTDSCWPYGDPNYGPNFPCDHFGVSTSVPPASVKYSWLVEQTPGSSSLVYADSGVPAPVWTITPQPPINNVPQPPAVEVRIEAPDIKPGQEFGEAKWAKVTATGTLNDMAVEDLMKENQVVKDARQQVQVEWQLIQKDAGNPNSGQIDLTGVKLDPEAKGVEYTFEFYKYTGVYDPETHEAQPRTSDTPAQPDPSDLGIFLVAQMAAVNFDGQVPPPEITLGTSIIPESGQVNTEYSGSVSATGGFGALTWVGAGLPPGVSVSTSGMIFGMPTTSGAFNPTFTVTDESGQTATVAGNITIVPPPDFTLSTTGSLSVKRGASVSSTITVGALNNFTGDVGLAVSGLPNSTTAAFTPSSITNFGSSAMKVTTSSKTPRGTYAIKLKAQSGALLHAQDVMLTVQ